MSRSPRCTGSSRRSTASSRRCSTCPSSATTTPSRWPIGPGPELTADLDPRAQLEGFVGVAAQINDRVALIYRILVSAAATDPDAAALLDGLTQQRQQGQKVIARSLARAGALRPGLKERDAADIIHALLSPEMYRLTVVDRGWSADRYRRWLSDLLVDQLLPADARRRRATRSHVLWLGGEGRSVVVVAEERVALAEALDGIDEAAGTRRAGVAAGTCATSPPTSSTSRRGPGPRS